MKEIGLKIIGKISVVLIILGFLFFLFLLFEGYLIRKDIKLNGKVTVGKCISHSKYKGAKIDYLIYNIDGIRYKAEGGSSIGSSESVGKFYKIRYSEKFKGSIEASFDQEVTDTIEILKAGFAKRDMNAFGNDSITAREASLKQEIFAILNIKE
ncbi:hypothetical protein SAMN05444671_0211 [Flavobacterium sp. CF108]|uniref:hypothetical protein n=1 Tax=unclassified Flavobacterium TaxID=196869 RepID=UPI0008B77F1E|nr:MULTISPECIES: hypothetical protein [unclassified Flavobacterium]SEO63259.1 hypothetical protein SAMN04487978_3261 [Flavobacterium sp. fv08]SHI06887.1 hypothetical protein SAMN05444671_0211 [Flavobacterium sp. CF108]